MIEDMPSTPSQPVFLDFDKDIQKSKVGNAEVLYVPNKDNSLYRLRYRYKIGSLNDIKRAISCYEINFNSPKLLTRLWSKNDKKGEKAIRVLRNKIVHELNESSLVEVIERKKKLHDDMDLFINTILDSEINIF